MNAIGNKFGVGRLAIPTAASIIHIAGKPGVSELLSLHTVFILLEYIRNPPGFL
jgi:hypothetical protein